MDEPIIPEWLRQRILQDTVLADRVREGLEMMRDMQWEWDDMTDHEAARYMEFLLMPPEKKK